MKFSIYRYNPENDAGPYMQAFELPDADLDREMMLLDALLLEKAVYELGYELNNRPDWVKIPIQGIRQQMGVAAD